MIWWNQALRDTPYALIVTPTSSVGANYKASRPFYLYYVKYTCCSGSLLKWSSSGQSNFKEICWVLKTYQIFPGLGIWHNRYIHTYIYIYVYIYASKASANGKIVTYVTHASITWDITQSWIENGSTRAHGAAGLLERRILELFIYALSLLENLDISRYNITRYCTQHNKIESKASARMRIHYRQPNHDPTGELCASFVSYFEKKTRYIGSALFYGEET